MASVLARIDRRRLGLSLIVAVALVALWIGVTSADTGDSGLGPTDPAIEAVSPAPDELVLRQTQVVVDLAPGYRGELYIDGQQIPVVDAINDAQPGRTPADRIDGVFDPALNTITFTPTVGATIEEFAPRAHQVTVTYWKLAESPDQARNFSWSFRVQG
jgi:hypothetical protein